MSEFEDIFKPVESKEVERREELANLEETCNNKKCGNCDHWMKTSICPPESRGHKMSMNGCICSKYVLCGFYIRRLIVLRKVVV